MVSFTLNMKIVLILCLILGGLAYCYHFNMARSLMIRRQSNLLNDLENLISKDFDTSTLRVDEDLKNSYFPAIRAFKDKIHGDNMTDDNYFSLGVLLMKAPDLEDIALKSFQEAIKLNPNRFLKMKLYIESKFYLDIILCISNLSITL